MDVDSRIVRDSGGLNVGLGEIVAFEKQRLTLLLRQGIAETVAEVQAGGMNCRRGVAASIRIS
jgi:hypothetical protein